MADFYEFNQKLFGSVWDLLNTPFTLPAPVGVVSPFKILLYFAVLNVIFWFISRLLGIVGDDVSEEIQKQYDKSNAKRGNKK